MFAIIILAIVGIVIIKMAENIHNQAGQKDNEGLTIVKGCVLFAPIVLAILFFSPKLILASVLIFVGKIVLTAAKKI